MAYSDIQQTEFNRATENLIEITWTYVNLQKEFPKLSETDSMGWKQMFVVWANEFEENFGRTDWDESEKTYQEAIEEFAKEKIFQWVGIRKYICIGRHIEGITLNPYEWLMEKGRKVKLFENEVEAKAYLRTNGYSDEDLEEDIKNAVEEFCDYWGIPKGIAGGLNDNQDIICEIASLYEKNQDTNVASADTMKEAVKQVLKKEGVWK